MIGVLYYLVALLDKYSYSSIEKIQKNISLKYNLYDELPMLHITLEVINNPDDLKNLCNVINNVLLNYGKFSIKINGAICFDPPFKSVNLKVEDSGTIHDLSRKLNFKLKKNGFRVRENIENWDLHISLANINFSKRDWSNEEFAEACRAISEAKFHSKAEIIQIQLWQPINDKTKMVIRDFNLTGN